MERAGGLLSPEDVQECIIQTFEQFTTTLETTIRLTPMTGKEAQRNLRFIALRPVLEAMVDRPELMQVRSRPVSDQEKGIFKTMEEQTLRVMLLQIGEKKPALVQAAP